MAGMHPFVVDVSGGNLVLVIVVALIALGALAMAAMFFLVGAGFSGTVGYLGMSLAVRANLRVAAAANETGRDPAMNIGFRTGAMVGMLTVGLGLLGCGGHQHGGGLLEQPLTERGHEGRVGDRCGDGPERAHDVEQVAVRRSALGARRGALDQVVELLGSPPRAHDARPL